MDSTNNFQHHEQQQHQQQHEHEQHLLQDHFAGCSSSSSPSSFALSTSLHWNPTLLSTTRCSETLFCNKVYENESRYEEESSSNKLFPKTEEDMLSSFPSFTTLINSPNAHNNIIMENSCSFNNNNININTSSRGLMNFPFDQQHESNYRDGIIPLNNWINNNTSHGFPGSNILQQLGLVSSSSSSTTSVPTCSPRLGLNMQAMDLLGVNTTFGTHLLHQQPFSPLGKNTPNNKALAPTNGIGGTKRSSGSSSCDQSKTSTTNKTLPNKKSLLKVSCPPLKVRKEKLGDRIAALHQLVSPFGKTDTASVLTEAIGYIQFLQDQIHTLCMPQSKPPPRNQLISKPFQIGGGSEDDGKDEEESEIDIRGRGLCLVPVSWTSYISPNQFDTSNTPFF